MQLNYLPQELKVFSARGLGSNHVKFLVDLASQQSDGLQAG
jgi:hypothetical protein